MTAPQTKAVEGSSPQPPWEHQTSGARFLSGNRALLADPLGTGKTRTALMAANGRTLIVMPPSLRYVWEDQLALYRPDLDVTLASYHSLTKRTKRVERGVLAEGDRLTGKKMYFDSIICDEAHYLKGRKTGWTQAFELLAKRCGQLAMLTGTPIPNWGHELYMPLRLIFPGQYTSYWRWAWSWFQQEYNPHSKFPSVGDLLEHLTWEDFAAQLAGHYLRRESPIELPPIVGSTIEVDMTPLQRTTYRQMQRELMAELGDRTMLAWNKGSAYTKLLILSTGVECAFSDATIQGGSGKLNALDDIMKERDEEPTVLFCHFRSSARVVAERIGALAVHGGVSESGRADIIRRWQAGDFPYLVATYGIGAEGHTWTRANCVVRVEATSRPSHMEQAIGRIHRAGQTRHCTVIDLVTRGTNDVRLRHLLAEKTDQQMAVMSALDLLGDY